MLCSPSSWRGILNTMARLKQSMTKASRWTVTPSTYAMKTNGVAQWLCAPPGSPLANPIRHHARHQLPRSVARLHPVHLGGLNTANQACGHIPCSNLLANYLAYPAAPNAVGRWCMEPNHVASQTDRRGDPRHLPGD